MWTATIAPPRNNAHGALPKIPAIPCPQPLRRAAIASYLSRHAQVITFQVKYSFAVFDCLLTRTHLADNVIVGNLIVKADPTFGGGELNFSGLCFFLHFFTILF